MPKTFIQAATFLFAIPLVVILFAGLARGQAATGGQFTLEKSVIAGGGREKQAPNAAENGTAGQAIAGHHSTGGQFALRSGFWTPEFELAPSAGTATVSGRVTTADGRGIAGARVQMTSATGETWLAVTASFGYFKFTDIPAGGNYVIRVRAKRFTFAESAYILEVTDDVAGITFTADP